MKPYFIDENINILMGDQALEALSQENDQEFLSEDKGIVKVSAKRWEKAQVCEKKHWLVKGLKIRDDRNHYHLMQFNNYEDIKKKHSIPL